MKAYVINMARSTNRRATMERRLKRLDIDFEFIDAFDASSVDKSSLRQYISEDSEDFGARNDWRFNAGTIGCAISHQTCYRHMISSCTETALILEDDVVFLPGFSSVLRCLDRNMSKDDLVLLFTTAPKKKGLLSSQGSVKANCVYAMYYANVRNLHSAAGYAIGINVAKSLLEANIPIRFPADVWSMYYKRGGYKYLRVVYPSPIMHEYANDFGTRSPVGMNHKLRLLRALYKVSPVRAGINAIEYLKINSKFKVVSDPSPYAPGGSSPRF